jgi:hypothetical protein
MSGVLQVDAILCTDASVGPKVAAAGIVFRLFSSNQLTDTTVFSAESLPIGLSIAESEALAVRRGYTLLRQVFNSHPLKLQLNSLLILTDNRTVVDLFTKPVRTRSSLMRLVRDEISADFVEPVLIVKHLTTDDKGNCFHGLIMEAHKLARSYKRNLGALIHD